MAKRGGGVPPLLDSSYSLYRILVEVTRRKASLVERKLPQAPPCIPRKNEIEHPSRSPSSLKKGAFPRRWAMIQKLPRKRKPPQWQRGNPPPLACSEALMRVGKKKKGWLKILVSFFAYVVLRLCYADSSAPPPFYESSECTVHATTAVAPTRAHALCICSTEA